MLNFAPRISASTLMVGATEDEIFARPRTERLFAAISHPKDRVWIQSGHAIQIEHQREVILPWLKRKLQ